MAVNPENLRNRQNKTPFEIAESNDDIEVCYLIYNNYLNHRRKKIEHNKDKAKNFLSMTPNFYLEMKWEVNVPLLSYFCPNDTCKIWKFYENVRMDYSFVDFKNVSSVRSPSSWFFLGNSPNLDIFLAEWEKKSYFNPFEQLEEDEKKLIMSEIMNSNRINGEFKLKNCTIAESKSMWTKKPVYEKVNGWNAKKYEVNITAYVNLHSPEKFIYENFSYDNYFDDSKDLGLKILQKVSKDDVKNNIVKNLKVTDEKMRKALMKMDDKGDKKLKAYVWVAENFPIKTSVNKIKFIHKFFIRQKKIKKLIINIFRV